MGSGSGGGGGGGTGGSRGRDGSGLGYGGYRFVGSAIAVDDARTTEKRVALRTVLERLPRPYLMSQFVDGPAVEIYKQLSYIGVELLQNRSWDGVAQRFGVDGAAGCLPRLSAAIMASFVPADAEQAVRKTIRLALENFLVRVVGDDPDRFHSASGSQVLTKVNRQAFDRLSNNFLGDLLFEVVRAEERALPGRVKVDLRKVVEERADEIVTKFEARFRGKPLNDIPQVGYRNLFDVIRAKPDWFITELRA